MNLEGIVLSEIQSNRERQRPFTFTYMWNLKNKHNKIQMRRYREQTSGCQKGSGAGMK